MTTLYQKALKDLKVAEKKIANLEAFANEVKDKDRLYVAQYGVWRRKDTAKSGIAWVRANPPEAEDVPKA